TGAVERSTRVAAERGAVDPEVRDPARVLRLPQLAGTHAGAVELRLALGDPTHLEEDPATHHRRPRRRVDEIRLAGRMPADGAGPDDGLLDRAQRGAMIAGHEQRLDERRPRRELQPGLVALVGAAGGLPDALDGACDVTREPAEDPVAVEERDRRAPVARALGERHSL